MNFKRTHPFLLFLVFLLSGCVQSSDPPMREKGVPHIEITECTGSEPDVSLERNVYFNKEVKSVNDTTTISFDFVRDCCMEFDGDWQIENEILTLRYYPNKENQEPPCECKCTYTMKYHFNHNDYSWKSIRIKRGL